MNIEIRFWTRNKLICYNITKLEYDSPDDTMIVTYMTKLVNGEEKSEKFKVSDISVIDFDTIPF